MCVDGSLRSSFCLVDFLGTFRLLCKGVVDASVSSRVSNMALHRDSLFVGPSELSNSG